MTAPKLNYERGLDDIWSRVPSAVKTLGVGEHNDKSIATSDCGDLSALEEDLREMSRVRVHLGLCMI